MGLRMISPAYFVRPLTYQSPKHLRLGKALTGQRPLRPTLSLAPSPTAMTAAPAARQREPTAPAHP